MIHKSTDMSRENASYLHPYLFGNRSLGNRPSATAGKPLQNGLSGLIQQATDWIRFSFFFLFITKKTEFDISCSGDNLNEVQILFSWKNEKNISKCRLLKIVPRVLSVKVCTNNSRMSLCMAKPTIKLVRRDGSACTLWDCTSVDLNCLIRAFANRKYLLWSLGVTKRLVRGAKTRVSTCLHILIRAFADHIYHR